MINGDGVTYPASAWVRSQPIKAAAPETQAA